MGALQGFGGEGPRGALGCRGGGEGRSGTAKAVLPVLLFPSQARPFPFSRVSSRTFVSSARSLPHVPLRGWSCSTATGPLPHSLPRRCSGATRCLAGHFSWCKGHEARMMRNGRGASSLAGDPRTPIHADRRWSMMTTAVPQDSAWTSIRPAAPGAGEPANRPQLQNRTAGQSVPSDHHPSHAWCGMKGWAGWGGVDRAPWLDPLPPQLRGPPKSYRDWAPGPGGGPDPKFGKKMKMGLLESGRRGGSEKSSSAMHLVGGGIDHFQWSKKLSVPSAPDFIITDEWSCLPACLLACLPAPAQYSLFGVEQIGRAHWVSRLLCMWSMASVCLPSSEGDRARG